MKRNEGGIFFYNTDASYLNSVCDSLLYSMIAFKIKNGYIYEAFIYFYISKTVNKNAHQQIVFRAAFTDRCGLKRDHSLFQHAGERPACFRGRRDTFVSESLWRCLLPSYQSSSQSESWNLFQRSFIPGCREWGTEPRCWTVTPVVLLFYSCHHDPVSCREWG